MSVVSKIEASNSLADLAARIRDAHRDVGMLLTRSVERAFDAGNLLIEAKRQLNEHGQWLPWLRNHVEISERTAQRYMRLAGHRAEIEAKSDTTMSDLTINGALALLTVPGIAEKTVAAVETSEAIQDKAEEARRQVMFDAIERTRDAVVALKKKWVPDDWVRDDSHDYKFSDEFFNELLEMAVNNGKEYDLAVECQDHAYAFELVSWAYDLSVDMRTLVEDIAGDWR